MAILYSFGGSVWGAVAELAAKELYPSGEIEIKTVNLVLGENFAPDFIKLNSNATLPTLEANGTVYQTTTDVVNYLVQNAPTKVDPEDKPVIALVHEEKYDPNFALLLFRNDEERKAKAAGIPGLFLAKRQAALETYATSPEGAAYKTFYESKLTANGGLLALMQGNAPETVLQDFYAKSQTHFDSVASALYDLLSEHLPATAGFIGGEQPGNADFHVGGWLARIAAVSGAKTSGEGLKALEASFGKPVPEKVAGYWNTWSARESWGTVYADGLH